MPRPGPVGQQQQQSYPSPDDQTIQHPPVQPISSLGLTQRPPHAPAQFRLKKASSVGAVCGNDSSYTNITDFSVTDGIDSEHQQEQRSEDARPTRASRSGAGQHKRNGSTPPSQPTLDRGARAAYQTNTASARVASDLGRSQYPSTRGATRSWYPPRYRNKGGIQSSQGAWPTISPCRGRK